MGNTKRQGDDNIHANHRQRVKQEFRDVGMGHFQDHKVVEMLLFYCVPRKDTNPLAHRLLDRFGSISSMVSASYDLLMEVEGVSVEVATYLKFSLSFCERILMDLYSNISHIHTTEEAKEYMRYRFVTDTTEKVIMTCLGQNGKILLTKPVASGTLEKVDIIPSDLVKLCLRADASGAILAHNHPGGFCNPSRKDVVTTGVINETMANMGIELVDHIIVASDGVLSMKEKGMFRPSK